MIMSGLEFPGEIPFSDVYIHSVIQAPDGRRMSKSLGTGIDPVSEIETSGADALRFGLLAMSSSQDVRYSEAKIGQGRDLANKLWNASRFVLLGADAEPAPLGERVEDRWIRSRMERAISSISSQLDAYDFAHAALGLYGFVFDELCDWYLEMAKPRLYAGDREVASNLLWQLERTVALAHPVMPFLTEEIWSYLPERSTDLAVAPFPRADSSRFDPAAEREIDEAIELTRALRRWRELADVPPSKTLSARTGKGVQTELIAALARFEFIEEGEAVAVVGPVEILDSDALDAGAVEARLAERRSKLASEVKREEGKLANQRFVDKAPDDVVEAERTKLERYRTELAELDG
jgi:valyl-tRNA synthetase